MSYCIGNSVDAFFCCGYVRVRFYRDDTELIISLNSNETRKLSRSLAFNKLKIRWRLSIQFFFVHTHTHIHHVSTWLLFFFCTNIHCGCCHFNQLVFRYVCAHIYMHNLFVSSFSSVCFLFLSFILFYTHSLREIQFPQFLSRTHSLTYNVHTFTFSRSD